MEQKNYDVFISYSRKDNKEARDILCALTDAGISCFFDELSIDDQRVWDVLVEEIEKCKIFLYLGSKNTALARFTPKELTYAVNHKDASCIYPYFLDDYELPKVHEFLLANIEWRKRSVHPVDIGLIPDLKRIIGKEGEKTTPEFLCLLTLKHKDSVESARFCPSGSKVVSASDDENIYIWDIKRGECVKRLKGHDDIVNSVSYSPDGCLILSASDDETIRIWDSETGKCIKVLSLHDDSVWSAVFSPNGRLIVSAPSDSMIFEQVLSVGLKRSRVFP